MTRPPNIPTVEEAQALVDAAELLDARFPCRLGDVVKDAREVLDTARDFDKHGALPIKVGSEIRYRDSQFVWRTGRVAKIGRKWITLANSIRIEIATGRGEAWYGWREQASDTDTWRLSRLLAKETP